jgi:hypothetical protein
VLEYDPSESLWLQDLGKQTEHGEREQDDKVRVVTHDSVVEEPSVDWSPV